MVAKKKVREEPKEEYRSIAVNADLVKSVKVYTIENNTTIRDFTREALEEKLQRGKKK